MNMMKMMKQAQQMQEKMQKIQAELAARHYEAASGGGAVKAVASGDGNLVSLKLDPTLLKNEEAEIIEDLIVTAVREATEKGKNEATQEMSKLTAGLGLPGMF